MVREEGFVVLGPEGFDRAIIGVGSTAKEDGTCEEVLVYDIRKMMEILMTDEKMSQEEAAEFLFFNIISVYLGEGGPFFVQSLGTVVAGEKDTIH